MQPVRHTFCVAAFLTILAGNCWCQIDGALNGVVLDGSGAVVAQAAVKLASLETGQKRETHSDSQGRFSFNLLKIGLYEVSAEAPSFRISVAQAFVRSGETARVRLVMELGHVTETITVTGAVSPLDVEDAQIQFSLAGEPVQLIPVSRDPNLLASTAPGVVPVTFNNTFLGSGSYNANGGRGRGNNVTVDNITATDISVTGTGGVLELLSFSQIKEVKLITNNFNAEYGRNANSQLLYVTKSGTNDFHGEAYDLLRNDKLNARPFFDSSGKPNVVRQNDYGFGLGGPILKNRTHFYTTYEGLKIRGASAARIARVPTAEMLARVTDPTSRSLLEQYRMPAAARSGAAFGEVEQTAATVTDTWQFSARIDHQFSERDSLTARYAHYELASGGEGLTFVGTNLANFGVTADSSPRQASLAETHVFSSILVNEARFGFGRSTPEFPIKSTTPLGPRIQFLNGQVDSFGPSEGFPQGRVQNTFQYADTLSWVRGAHNVKLGADVFRYQANSYLDAYQRPRIRFATWDDFAAGLPYQVSQMFGSSVRGHRVTNHSYFFQDDWKLGRTLTLNLGLRLEVAGGVSEVNHVISNLDLDCHDSLGRAGAGPLGCFSIGEPSFRGNLNWGPRFGFAWTPFADARTVVRGGYGITYDFIYLSPITGQRFLPPFITTATLTGQSSFAGADSYGSFVAGTSQLGAETSAQVGHIDDSVLNYGNVRPMIDAGLRNPQVHQFSLGIERELGRDLVLKLGYVGAKGNYLQRTRPLNPIQDPPRPATSIADENARLNEFRAAISASSGSASRLSNRLDPRFNQVDILDSSANSNYHSLQVEVQKRFAQGYMLHTAYTFGKSIDDVSDAQAVLINDSASQQNPLDNRDNRAPSQFDVRQRLVITHLWEPRWGEAFSNRVLRRLAGGWGFAGITSFQSGFPVTLDAGVRRGISALTMTGILGGPVRPNSAGPFDFRPVPAGSANAPATLTGDPVQPVSSYAASLGLSQPMLGNFGSLGRNTGRLNGIANFSWNVYKNFFFSERLRLQIRAEFYNLLNNTSFQDVDRTITSPGFGQYFSVAQESRQVQLAARIIF